MRLHGGLALALAVVTTLAGCVSVPIDPATTTPAKDAPLLDWATRFESTGGATVSEELTTLHVPEGAGGLFVAYNATLGADSSLEWTARSPDGNTYALVAASTLLEASEVSGWRILPGAPGEWRVPAMASGDVEAALRVTARAPVPLEPVAGTGEDRVVVAVVDTGANPYHEVFRSPALTTDALPARVVDAATGGPPVSVPVTAAESYLEAVERDAGLWAAAPARTLVHFEGTNVLGYHLDDTELPALPVLDRAGHGTMVSHAVVRENPDALVVMISGSDWDAGVEWAASQPWIDLISLSWGPAVNAAGPVDEATGRFRTMDATLAAHEAGKIVFTATGNDPTLAFTDTTSGPPWVHAVSGMIDERGGRALLSGNLVDTVANWTQTLARYDSADEVADTAGTSFATPTTAGVASRILHEVRTTAGHTGGIVDGQLVATAGVTVTNADLRAALNATAFYGGPLEYEPGSPTAVPVAPTPWVSQGWGHVDGRIVTPAAAALLGDAPLPEKPAEAEAWMEANLDVRRTYWGR